MSVELFEGMTRFASPKAAVTSGEVRSIPELFQWHARENPGYPFFRYHNGEKLDHISYAQLHLGIHRAARYISARIPSPTTIAVLANVGASYYCAGVVAPY